MVLLYYRTIVLIAGERIFKIDTLLAKLQENGLISSHALFEEHCPGESADFAR